MWPPWRLQCSGGTGCALWAAQAQHVPPRRHGRSSNSTPQHQHPYSLTLHRKFSCAVYRSAFMEDKLELSEKQLEGSHEIRLRRLI